MTGRPRLLTGFGPLARTSDRVQAVSRWVLALLLVCAVPLGVVVGTAVLSAVHRTAAEERAARTVVPARLLADAAGSAAAPAEPAPAPAPSAVAPATWQGPHGARQGQVEVAAGATAGSVVRIWIDRSGAPTTAPVTEPDLVAEAALAGLLAACGAAGAALLAHLGLVALLDRSRSRRWAQEWAAVAPDWAAGLH